MTGVDTDSLPAKQYLILEVLAARHRLGEPFWPLPDRLLRHLDALADAGLIGHESDVTEGHRRAWLTDKGWTAVMSGTYTAPAQPPDAAPASPRETAARVTAQLAENLTALDSMAGELPADQGFLALMVTDLTKQVRRLAEDVARNGQGRNAPANLRAALRKAAEIMAMSSADYSNEHDRAALYSLFVGWDDAVLDEVAARWDWTPEQVTEIRQMRAAIWEASRG